MCNSLLFHVDSMFDFLGASHRYKTVLTVNILDFRRHFQVVKLAVFRGKLFCDMPCLTRDQKLIVELPVEEL